MQKVLASFRKIPKKALYFTAVGLIVLSTTGFWWLNQGRVSAVVSYITACSAAANNIASCSGVQSGDLIVVFAYRNGNTTAPTLPGTYTNITNGSNSGGGTNASFRAGRKVAVGANEGSATWTNATNVLMQVYRGQHTSTPIGNTAIQTGNNSANFVRYGNGTTALQVADGSSWWAGMAGRTTGHANMATAPSGMNNRTSNPATPVIGGHDTNGGTSSSWSQTDVSGYSTSVKYLSVVMEIRSTPNVPPAAPTLSSPSNGATLASVSPALQFNATDNDNDYLRYRVRLYNTAANNGTICQGSSYETGDQTSSQAGFSGQDTQGGTAYDSTGPTTATYTVQSAMTRGNSYCWQVDAIDPGGTNTFGDLSTPRTFTVNDDSAAPTLSSPAASATGVPLTPEFSLSTTDTENDYVRFRLHLYQSDCSTPVGASPFNQNVSQTGWAGQDADSATAYGTTGPTTAVYTYQGTLSYGTTYCWQADAIDYDGSGVFSGLSATRTFTTLAEPIETIIQGGVEIRPGTTIQ